jgi:HpiC1 cyclase/PEP-CTERM motif
MKILKIFSSAIFCAAGLAALGAKADAASIPVVNSDFSMFPTVATNFAGFTVGGPAPQQHPYLFFGCGNGCAFADDNIVGWTSSGTFAPGIVSGQFQIGVLPNNQIGAIPQTRFNADPMINATTPEPIVVRAQNASVSQIVSTTATPGVTYTLNVDVGFAKDAVDKGFVELIVGHDTPVFATPLVPNPNMQKSGNWFDFEASYTATAADNGAPIEIFLSSLNNGQGFSYWGDVRLTDSLSVSNPLATPEPATWAMMLIGFGGMAGVAAVRRRSLRQQRSAVGQLA